MKSRRIIAIIVFLSMLGILAVAGQGNAPAVQGYRFYAAADDKGRVVAWLGVPDSLLAQAPAPKDGKVVIDMQFLPNSSSELKGVANLGNNVGIRFGIYRLHDHIMRQFTEIVPTEKAQVQLWVVQTGKGDGLGIAIRKGSELLLLDAYMAKKGKSDIKVEKKDVDDKGVSYALYTFSSWPASDPYAIVPPFD